MKQIKIFLLVAVFFMFFVGGCAWQRIPVAPDFNPATTFPIKVGIILADNQPSSYYGPGIINYWKQTKLFESVIFPYREGDPVDGTLKIAINGGWKGEGAGAGFLIGLTLGLASPAVGPSMTGIHDATTILFKGPQEIAQYSVHVESSVTWGMGANTEEVSSKADALQTRKLAVEIARKLDESRGTIMKAFAK